LYSLRFSRACKIAYYVAVETSVLNL
jgi:hypothetical protein